MSPSPVIGKKPTRSGSSAERTIPFASGASTVGAGRGNGSTDWMASIHSRIGRANQRVSSPFLCLLSFVI